MTEDKNQQEPFRIVTWNCTQGHLVFLNKIEKIVNWPKDGKKADVYIIQECPDPEEFLNKLDNLGLQCAGWDGHDGKAGIGIFVNTEKDLVVE